MKPLYLFFYLIALLFFCVLSPLKGYAQCPPGHTETSVAYDTTISFPSGATSMIVKFPKFDPLNGMVTCMKMCISVGGVVDSLSFENNDKDNGNTYVATYTRTDFLTGPGIAGALINNINRPYSFPLSPSDNVVGSVGIPNGSGPDFGSVSKDTIVSAESCQTITSSLDDFYGTDSLAYMYNISGGLNISSSANATITIATSGFVHIKFQYCICPATVLPLNVNSFIVTKVGDDKAELSWSGYDDQNANYHYEAEVSRNAYDFKTIALFDKKNNGDANDFYHFVYTADDNQEGIYYFRIKQVYANGYVRYSNIRQIKLESSASIKFSLYPNPSNGIVGIKFANKNTGQFEIHIYNTQGQMILKKDILMTESSLELRSLKSGAYWVKLIDKKSQASCVTQLFIK